MSICHIICISLHNSGLVNEFSEEGETCLMLSAIEQSLELATLLIDNGADINARALGEDVSQTFFWILFEYILHQ